MAEDLAEARTKKVPTGEMRGGAERSRTRPRAPVDLQEPAPRPEHRSKSRITKSVRYELENALVGLCDVWFEDIKPHLLRNNIKVHVHEADGHSGGGGGGGEGAGGDRKAAGGPGCSHIDPGAALDPQQRTSANCADSCLLRRPTLRARYRKQPPPPSKHQPPTHLTKETQKFINYDTSLGPLSWLPLVTPVTRPRRRRSRLLLLHSRSPSCHVVPRGCRPSVYVPPLELHGINNNNHLKRKRRRKYKIKGSYRTEKSKEEYQTEELKPESYTKTKATQTGHLPEHHGEHIRKNLLTMEMTEVHMMLNKCQSKYVRDLSVPSSSSPQRETVPMSVRLNPPSACRAQPLPDLEQQAPPPPIEQRPIKPRPVHRRSRRNRQQRPILPQHSSPTTALKSLALSAQPAPQPVSRIARQTVSQTAPQPVSQIVPQSASPITPQTVRQRLPSSSDVRQGPAVRRRSPLQAMLSPQPAQQLSSSPRNLRQRKSMGQNPATLKRPTVEQLTLSPRYARAQERSPSFRQPPKHSPGFAQQHSVTSPELEGHIPPTSYPRQTTKTPSASRLMKAKPSLAQKNNDKSPLFDDDLIEIIGASHDKVVKQLNRNSKRYSNCLSLGQSQVKYADSKKTTPWR